MSDGDRGALSFRVLPFERLDSTNEEARRQVCAGVGAGTVIWALDQMAGRGRRGRAWVSEAGNLFCSLILRPGCPPAGAAEVSLVAALAVAEAAEAALGGRAPVRVKWPNDVLAGGRKLAGILLETETRAGGADIAALVVGVGINIAHAPEGTEFPATALAREGAPMLEVRAVLDLFLGRFAHWYRRWTLEGLGPVRSAWLARAAGLDGPVTVRLHDETLCGSFIGLDASGALLLDPGGGAPVRRVAAGDVFFPASPVSA
ncbi:MAG: biotin--[acetyl-CoA-carboxylase] ligase [Rhodospirillaceae bacterium]